MQRVHFHGTCNDPIELPQKHDETRRRHHIDSLAFEKFLELIQPFRREFDEVSVSEDQSSAAKAADQVSRAVAKHGADKYRDQHGFDVESSMQGQQ